MRSRSVRTVGLLLMVAALASGQAVRAENSWSHDWVRGAVFYEVFVRSFQDSGADGIGDLSGLISRLDYLNDGNPAGGNDLGVDALWLMPVFDSPSYHGYDTVDYRSIEPDYGNDNDLRRLCDEAHRRGMKVILDLVLNHTSSQNPWFVDSASGPASSKRDWYVWSNNNPGWQQPWGGGTTWYARNGAFYYGVFWSGMPDLNFTSAEVRAEARSIADYWMERGVDGFRLDAARYVIETGSGSGQQDTQATHAFWREFAEHVRTVKPDAVLVGENWSDTATIATYYGEASNENPCGDELPLNFNFPLSFAVIEALNTNQAAPVARVLRDVVALYPACAIDAPFLTNHDQRRLASQVNRSTAKQRAAAALLLTLPGAPFIYYGEEIGLPNGTGSGDEAKRTPMPWDARKRSGFTTATPWYPYAPGKKTVNVERARSSSSSLFAHYRTLIALRQGTEALREGDIELLTNPDAGGSMLAFLRRSQNETVLVVQNLGSGFASTPAMNFAAGGFTRLFPSSGSATPFGRSGAWQVSLPSFGTGVWRVQP
ncbi:MAG: alpha-amylase family glycosyl hydrolase [Acidobacteriota bacterium]